MSKFEINEFAKTINEYLTKNNFKFYATIKSGGVGIRFLSDNGTIDTEKPFFKYYSYGTILRMPDVIIEDFLTSLGLEIKLDILTETDND